MKVVKLGNVRPIWDGYVWVGMREWCQRSIGGSDRMGWCARGALLLEFVGGVLGEEDAWQFLFTTRWDGIASRRVA